MGEEALELVHTNAAILSLVGDKVNECISKKKFASLKNSPRADDAPQSAAKRARSIKKTTITTSTSAIGRTMNKVIAKDIKKSSPEVLIKKF